MNQNLLRSLLVICLFFVAESLIAQPPTAWNQTFVAKDSYNAVAKNRRVYVQIAIKQGNPVNPAVWLENFEAISNDDGLFTIIIGRGNKQVPPSGVQLADIGQIAWDKGPYFISTKIAVAPSIPAPWWIAAQNYVEIPTVELMSVPYALYAGNATVTNVNTSIQPGPPNTFLVTDSSGNVNWRTPQAANTSVTTITNFNLNLDVITGQNVTIDPNTTAVVDVRVEGVRKGDPILVTPQGDYVDWSVYAAWVHTDNIVKVRLANFTPEPVEVLGSQYKIVVIKN